jgi:hypothetical protein
MDTTADLPSLLSSLGQTFRFSGFGTLDADRRRAAARKAMRRAAREQFRRGLTDAQTARPLQSCLAGISNRSRGESGLRIPGVDRGPETGPGAGWVRVSDPSHEVSKVGRTRWITLSSSRTAARPTTSATCRRLGPRQQNVVSVLDPPPLRVRRATARRRRSRPPCATPCADRSQSSPTATSSS